MNLQKLKDASLQEIRVRATQKFAALSERCGSKLAKLPTDQRLAALLTSQNGRSKYDLWEYFRIRSKPVFFTGLQNPEKTAAEFRSLWPDATQAVVEKADRICEGKFDLLGFSNFSFGDPIDWHLEPTSGKRLPRIHWSKLDYLDSELAGDKKITWELNRHQYFVTLGQAYLLTANERYARTFTEHLEAWMESNPPKLGINWASSLEVSFRSMSWLWSFYFFKSSSSFTAETFKRALKFLYLNARHLESYLSTYFSPNTHLTGEALGLFFLGTLLPEFKEARRWQDLGSRILIDQLSTHVRSDGVYFEQSSYYHRYTTDFYLQFLLLSRVNDFRLPAAVEEALLLLLDHLMYITRPDGTTPLFGDDDGGRLTMLDFSVADDFRGTLATGALLFDRGDYKFVAGDATEGLLWLAGPEGLSKFDSIVPRQPVKTSAAFPHGGYFVMRDGWTRDSNYLLFDCGPHGSLNCGHAHSDALSIDVAANGKTVIIDPGTCTYTGSKELRDWFRSSHAHNTVTVDGESSSVPDGPFSWRAIARCSVEQWISHDRFDFISGRHDGFMRLQDPVMVKRDILFLKGDYWIIRDTITSSNEHRVDVRFHTDSPPGSELGIQLRCFGKGRDVEEEAFVSHCYGQKELAKTFTFSGTLKGGDDIISFLLPDSTGNDWKVREIECLDGHAFEVCGGKFTDLVMIPVSDAWVWTRHVDGQVKETVSTQG